MVKEISREDLKQKMEEGNVTVVEVLGKPAYDEEHIKGAINLPVNEVEEKAEEVLPDKDAEIVVYCANKACQASPNAAKMLEDMGYTNVADYEHGKSDWKEAGLPMESSA